MTKIYKIYNDVNDKLYIGATKHTLRRRFSDHAANSRRFDRNYRPLYVDMNEFGIDKFHIELIEEVDDSLRDERERYWIEYCDSCNNGYNIALGGAGKPLLKDEEIIELYNEHQNIQIVSRLTGFHPDSISQCLHRNNVAVKPSSEISKENGYAVAQYTKDGQLVAKYLNITEAAEHLNHLTGCSIQAARRHIPEVCRGKRKTAHGFVWQRIDKSEVT